MERSYDYLIVGAGVAGHSAAAAIRKLDTRSSLAILGDEPHRPYNRPPLTKAVLTGQAPPDSSFVEAERFYSENGIELIIGTLARSLDAGSKTITAADGTTIAFGKLLLATGGRARRLRIPGSELQGIFALRTLDESLAIRQSINSGPARSAVVIGGGFIGAEVAASLNQTGVQVTMIFPEARILEHILPGDLGEFVQAAFTERGVRIISGDVAAGFAGAGRVEKALTKEGREIACDLAVVGIGIRPATELAAEAGLELAEDGGVEVTGLMRTSAADIWAAGDIASFADSIFGARRRVEHWDTAKAQGAAAGEDMAGQGQPFGHLTSFFTSFYNFFIQVHGRFSREDVIRRGSPGSGSAAYFSFQDGLLDGYLNLGRPPHEQEQARRLILQRLSKADLAGALADESVDLADL